MKLRVEGVIEKRQTKTYKLVETERGIDLEETGVDSEGYVIGGLRVGDNGKIRLHTYSNIGSNDYATDFNGRIIVVNT